jgi:hypothetical protein
LRVDLVRHGSWLIRCSAGLVPGRCQLRPAAESTIPDNGSR